MRNSPATKGTKYLSREDKRLRHRASCHGEAEREGNAMSLDRPGRREPKIQFLLDLLLQRSLWCGEAWPCKNRSQGLWRTNCAFSVTLFATLKMDWTPSRVTVCYYSSGVEEESLAHRQTHLQAKKRDINISHPLRHTQTHTHSVEEEWNVGSSEGWNVTVRSLHIPGSNICLGLLSRGGAVLLCTV